MGFSKTFAAVAALATVASAASSARSSVAAYWGQSGGSLRDYCDTADTDYIPIGFINYFPAQANGWPGSNYASSCWAEYYNAPGYQGVDDDSKNLLLSYCPGMAQDMQYCQSKGKKILLSLGGGYDTYHLSGKVDGEAFADFLWGAYGPNTTAWAGPRPFDPIPGSVGDEIATVVDGYDFDIEFPDTDNSVGYIAMINKLRGYFPAGSNYLITGAPQCVVNDANMDLMIQGAQFDIIWVQFYNTWGCSVRDWVTKNPNYASTGIESPVDPNNKLGGFYFEKRSKRLQAPNSKSKNAKLAIGVLGQATETGVVDFRVSADQLKPLIDAYFCHANFGGFMIWDLVASSNNLKNGVTFQAQIKNLLNAKEAKGCPTVTTTSSVPTPTTTQPPNTTIIDGTAYPNPPAPTVLGSTPKCKKWYVVQNGDTCTAIAAKNDITRTDINLWNTYITSTCTNIWATYAVCVSSPLAEDYWSSVGCLTDSQSARALANRITLTNEKSIMTPKACSDACAAAGYRLSGLEYGFECYCDNAIRNGHGLTQSGCTTPCPGAPSITCGGPDRINLYRLDKYKDLGCYTDIATSRTLEKQIIITNQNTILTREICQTACEKAGYIYSGVEYAHQCWCGNTIRGSPASSGCSSACPGNTAQTCGGSDRINVMMRPQSRSLGCYSDDVNKRTLRYQLTITNAATLMTVELCRTTCLTKGFIYSGVEYGHQCFCDDELYGTGVPSTGCTMACPGGGSAVCGGSSRINIYSL
ncbi:hypothetical protein VE04_06692 [Pseudogymnoascus sp. 24MN13]|nr:hypothetical protein VE04_06692 [Pseudogymnoascus sp. 24MN13]